MNTKLRLIIVTLVGFGISLLLGLLFGTQTFNDLCREFSSNPDTSVVTYQTSFEGCSLNTPTLETWNITVLMYAALLVTHVFLLTYTYKGQVRKSLSSLLFICVCYFFLYGITTLLFNQVVLVFGEGRAWLSRESLFSPSGITQLKDTFMFIIAALIGLTAPSLVTILIKKLKPTYTFDRIMAFILILVTALPIAIILIISVAATTSIIGNIITPQPQLEVFPQ